MKSYLSLAAIAAALALSGCGKKDDGTAAPASVGPITAVAAPAGTSWSETVKETGDGGYLMGNPDAKVKIAEYGSYSCSHCRDFSAESAEPLKKLVDTGKVAYEYHNFVRDPLDMSMVLLARCGGKDPFFPLSEQLFGYQATLFEKVQSMGDGAYQAAMAAPANQRFIMLANATGLIDFIKARGISEDQAKQCLADGAKAEEIAKTVQADQAKYNIEGTPTILINGSVLQNVTTWDSLSEKLKEMGV